MGVDAVVPGSRRASGYGSIRTPPARLGGLRSDLVRRGESYLRVAAGGLYDRRDEELLQSVLAWQVLNEKVLALEWSTRHTIRAAAGGAAVVGALRNIDPDNIDIRCATPTWRAPRSAGQCCGRSSARFRSGSTPRRNVA